MTVTCSSFLVYLPGRRGRPPPLAPPRRPARIRPDRARFRVRGRGATVATTVSTANVELAAKLGADIVIDYRTQNYEDHLSDFDVILDTLGGNETTRAMKVLAPGGTLISVVAAPDPSFAQQLGKPFLRPVMWWLSRRQRKAAKAAGVNYRFLFMRASGEQLA